MTIGGKMRNLVGTLAIFFLIPLTVWSADSSFVPREIRTAPGMLKGAKAHVQGICCDEDAIYLVFSNYIYKIDWEGRLLASVEAAEHSGDPCLANGHLYVSMSSSDAKGVYEYDTDLNLTRKFDLEKARATDGITYLNGSFFIGGPSTVQPHTSNYILEYDQNFQLLREHHLDFGVETIYGPQSVAAWNDSIFWAFYTDEKAPYRMVRADTSMKPLNRYATDGSNGIDFAPLSKQGDLPRFIIARTVYEDGDTRAVIRWFELDGDSFRDITAE